MLSCQRTQKKIQNFNKKLTLEMLFFLKILSFFQKQISRQYFIP